VNDDVAEHPVEAVACRRLQQTLAVIEAIGHLMNDPPVSLEVPDRVGCLIHAANHTVASPSRAECVSSA
jgi:hypothetical protein